MVEHVFGGDWTKEKLNRVSKYLSAYVQILKDRDYHYSYIDAFAGTGYVNSKLSVEDEQIEIFPELTEGEGKEFIEGSARIALGVKPSFRQYYFIDKDPKKARDLERMKLDFPESHISVISEDSNVFLKRFCKESDWRKQRAVIFLDPYGMQIPWTTIQDIANTGGIDLWYLFPAGIAINRLLRRDGKISIKIKDRLNQTFGSTDWFDLFYQANQNLDLFGENTIEYNKIADLEDIKKYFIGRLKEVFHGGVAENPLWLVNSRNTPLYLLCFACSNRNVKSAVKIAQHVLEQPEKKQPSNKTTYPTIPGLNI
ncbi:MULTISPECIES: three-Cys-motif partner protein TcmP [Cyanophyceae]|uniref:Three-Cys-motif partner protein TcmP n=1 Tax=Leptolyngbya subtilissima DQ-A4 TaxID=2933933 RepID=A0ABV0K4N7_9CYAN|nr:three-Cys-motif partner protein TcmP [Nodosilinea sp. FACHB-141]MBD2113636.1 three-Cys-motif partner protein TcmP [Nodosilinea sp. FACHB-141]